MTKQNKYIFVCQGCGHQAPKWMGRCPECGQWNSYIEEISESGERGAVSSNVGRPQVIEDISINNEQRLKTGIIEFDRALRSEEHTSELQSRLHLVCRL